MCLILSSDLRRNRGYFTDDASSKVANSFRPMSAPLMRAVSISGSDFFCGGARFVVKIAYHPSASRLMVKRFTFPTSGLWTKILTSPMPERQRPFSGVSLNPDCGYVSELYLCGFFHLGNLDLLSKKFVKDRWMRSPTFWTAWLWTVWSLWSRFRASSAIRLKRVLDVDLCSSLYLPISSAFRSL